MSDVTAMDDLRRRFEPLLRRVFHLYWRFARGMTLGVRGVGEVSIVPPVAAVANATSG